MVDGSWLEKAAREASLNKLLATNEQTAAYGLVLSEADAQTLLRERQAALKQEMRVEFGEMILPKIIQAFCASRYIAQADYVDTLIRLQEIFFLYKNEMADEITDEELLNFMQEQFETVCCGDLAYLEGTCLDIFAQAVRAGYRGYQARAGRASFAELDVVK